MKIVADSKFDIISNDDRSGVFEVFPDVFGDSRGFFCEVMKDRGVWPDGGIPLWFSNMQWVRQVNRSSSAPGTVRGCHAQTGMFCQGKLVCALTERIYDVITDARPDSSTFGKTVAYVLDPVEQNMLWVPRGFLHSFAVPFGAKSPALFEYWCDNTYSAGSETGVNPMSILPACAAGYSGDETFGGFRDMFGAAERITLSGKDTAAPGWTEWSAKIFDEYRTTGKAWYR